MAVEAEFDDPVEVFEWRVVTTTAADGTPQHHLERLITAQFAASATANSITLKVPRLGNLAELNYQVRAAGGLVRPGVLSFPAGDSDPQQVTQPVSGQRPFVVLVEGYALAIARNGFSVPPWP